MKGLVISWFFPPINSSEGLVTFKLIKNSKFKYDVFTQSANKDWSYDTNETKLINENIKNLNLGDSPVTYSEWVEKGVKYFENNMDEYDFIMSRSMPPESHQIAIKLKEKNPEKFWIASFGDPIADNPYNRLYKDVSPYTLKGTQFEYIPIKYIVSPKRIIKNCMWNLKKYRYNKKNNINKIHEKIQKETIEKADLLIFNNKYQCEYMLKNYEKKIKDKSIIIPHTFDSDFYYKDVIKQNNKIIIRHLGHLDCTRTPIKFLEALTELKKDYKNLENKLLVELYGDVSDVDKLYIINNELCDIVKVKKPVKYFESLRLMQESDLLLLVDANLSSVVDKNIFFAAKIADYIGSGTNIFGITMTEGPSVDILRETNGIISSYSSNEIYMKLRKIIDNNRIPEQKNAQNYNVKNISKIFDELVEKKLKER